jgi:hypothetical protein
MHASILFISAHPCIHGVVVDFRDRYVSVYYCPVSAHRVSRIFSHTSTTNKKLTSLNTRLPSIQAARDLLL